ncbi:MAG: hypothetical protein EPO08_20965 [Rhodospirillaceae bacterium]|nr:MAG: hypothetical protein EPO08_20965 [Rhodospirillaceae bacterium]
MAIPSTPVFRSLSQVVGDMVATFLSELDRKGIVPGIQSLKPASPYLAIFEATGQSQFRNQEQTLSLLDANDIDLAHGQRLDRIGAAEKLPRRGATFASGLVNISDTSFTKVATKIYQGKAAPIPGSSVIYVSDASSFTASGALYIGRGTPNLEGPLAYSSKANAGAYWTISLSAPTSNFHGLGETVTLAQGGDRVVLSGQTVQTPQGNVGQAAIFVTTSAVTLLDGETLVLNVPITARVPSTDGNVSAGGIKSVTSPAFSGMAVTNPVAITNGLDVENDDHYRERIKSARRAKAGVGTALGLSVYAYGVEAPDEAATVVSAQYVNRNLLPSLLVIDDGTGYEAKDAGIAFEVLMDSANGGEQVFFLNHGQPVAKASITTIQAAPYALSDEAILTVVVGDITYTHTFATANFANIANATAYEVVASINSNSTIPFSARTVGAGTFVAIFAKDDVNDSIQVIATPAGTDANSALDFSTSRIDPLSLYKNDVLLSKDGNPATLTSAVQAVWSPTSSGETLIVSVDGTPYQIYTILDSDFIALGLGFTVVSSLLPLSAWAAVLNAKVPGISCSVSGSTLVLTSNLGSSARASIAIDPASSLVVKGIVDPLHLTAQGRARDYVLDRNRGQIDLTQALLRGDRLTAGTSSTRAYLQSSALGVTTTVPAGGYSFWFAVDGDAQVITHTLNASHRIRQDWTPDTRTFTAFVGAGVAPVYPFTGVQVGDIAIWSDDAWSGFGGAPTTFSMMRVSKVDLAGQWFQCDYPTTGGPTASGYNDPALPVFQRLFFVRTDAVPQLVSLSAGSYSRSQVAAGFVLKGASAAVFTNNSLRVTTNTYAPSGDIALVAQNINAISLGFLVRSATQNDEPETAAIESGSSEVGSPDGVLALAITSLSNTTHVGSALSSGAVDGSIYGGDWVRAPSSTSTVRWGTNTGDYVSWTGTTLVPEVILDHVLAPPRPGVDLLAAVSAFRVGPLGILNVVFDNDSVTKGFTIPMTRLMNVDVNVPYGQTIRLLDGDNLDILSNPQSLAKAFGTTFDFSNFVLHGHARTRYDLSATQSGNTDTLLLRLKTWNGRNVAAKSNIQAPLGSAAALAVSNVAPLGDVIVYLASGAARAVTVTAGDHLRGDQAAPATTATINSAFSLTSIVRAGSTVTVTLTRPTTDTQSSGFSNGQSVYVFTNDANFPSGFKTIGGVAAAFPVSTFTYSEAGAAVAGSVVGAFAAYDSSPEDFTAVQVGDYLSVPTSYWSATDALGATRVRFRVTAKSVASPSYWVRVAATTLTGSWQTVVLPTDISFFPLSSNTTTSVVAAINALATSSITAVLAGGPGTSLISQVEGTTLQGALVDALLHISSATYNAAPLIQNYDITLKLAPSVNLTTTPNDWVHETFRLAPTTAKNVADYLNQGQVTGLASTGAAVQASSRGHRVQLASGVSGSGGAVQVSGGTANTLRTSVLAARILSGDIVANIATTASLEALSNRVYARLDNAQVLPKLIDWTGATTLTAVAGAVTVGGAGTAWDFAPIDPTFGTRWLFNRVGKYILAVPTVNPVAPSIPGGWVHFEPGFGKWRSGVSRATAVIGAAYATLTDSRVLSIGGSTTTYNLTTMATTTAVEAYDPVADAWYTMTSLPVSRAFGAAVTLADGRVLFSGGVSSGALAWHNTAYIFDPTAGALGIDGRPVGTWTVTTGNMSVVRAHHTMSLMSTGQVLVAGGSTGTATTTNLVDLFTPGTGLFVATGNLNKSRGGHHAFSFGIDQVLVVGGEGAVGAGYEIYTLSTTLWTNDQPLGFAETRVGHAVVAITPTTFLVAGGAGAQATINSAAWSNIRSTCEIYNVSTHTTVPVGSMAIPRTAFSGALVSGSKIVAYGGLAALPTAGAPTITPQGSAEVFDVISSAWSFASATNFPHIFAPPIFVSGSKVFVAESYYSGSAQVVTERFDANLLAAPAGNTGTFRVLNVSTDHLMFEAPNAVSAECDFGYAAFYDYDSVLPGDALRISSTVLGNAPQGSYTVLGIDLFDKTKFSVSSTLTFATGALGANLPFVNIVAQEAARMLYNVLAILPDDLNVGQSLVSLSPDVNVEHFNASAGSVLTFQDKLEFDTNIVPGRDAYRYNTGLIAEVTKVIYGDERDVITYPGYASAGAAVDVSAPLIRRIIISLAIRSRAGAVDVKSRVQAAVTKVINSAPPGPIAISLIIEEVQQVDGVASVVMLSPVPTTATDTIPVQPYEKALILDPANDVQVSSIGA